MSEAVDISYANGNYQPGSESLVIANASRANIGLAVGSFYHRQIDNARAAGKSVGHYFFNGNIDPVRCADFFVDNLYGYRPGDLLVIDCEYETTTKTQAWDPSQAMAFLDRVVQRTGAPYSSTAAYINRSIRGQWNWAPLWAKGVLKWIASPGVDPGDWDIWQYSSAGGVDRNHTRFTQLAGGSATVITNILEEDEMPKWYNTTDGKIWWGAYYVPNTDILKIIKRYEASATAAPDMFNATEQVWIAAALGANGLGAAVASVDIPALTAAIVKAIPAGAVTAAPDSTAILDAVSAGILAHLADIGAAARGAIVK
jgi:hypothetical protein